MPLRGEAFTGPIPKPQSRAAEKKQADREADTHWRKVRTQVLIRHRSTRWACTTSIISATAPNITAISIPKLNTDGTAA